MLDALAADSRRVPGRVCQLVEQRGVILRARLEQADRGHPDDIAGGCVPRAVGLLYRGPIRHPRDNPLAFVDWVVGAGFLQSGFGEIRFLRSA